MPNPRKLGCTAQHQTLNSRKGVHAQSASWDARPNTEPLTPGEGCMPNPQAGMHGPTPNPELQERGACPICKLGCTAQHRTLNSLGEGFMPNPQVRMHGLTNSTTYHGPECMPGPEAGMHGPTLPNKSVECVLNS